SMMRLPVSAAFLLVFISQVFGDLIRASVGDDVKFPLSEECMEGHGALNLHLKDGSIQAVASLHGDWEAGRAYIGRLNPPQVTYGNGFESRVSISSDWYQRADLSLRIKRVQLRDQGVYFCDLDKTERHRSPTQTTSEANGRTLVAVCITAVVFLVCGLVCGWLLKSHCSTSRLLRRFGPGD
uniref:Uncharacterized protein n=1 Tax=Neolamprologus brichardi TaxID=32507 RepID=A0A3Q4I1Z8_NEOBR